MRVRARQQAARGRPEAAGRPARREARRASPRGRVKPGCCCPTPSPSSPPPLSLPSSVVNASSLLKSNSSIYFFLGGPSTFRRAQRVRRAPLTPRHARIFCTPTAPGPAAPPQPPLPWRRLFSGAPEPLHPAFFLPRPPGPNCSLAAPQLAPRALPDLRTFCISALHSLFAPRPLLLKILSS